MPIIEISSLSHPGVEMFCTLTEAQLRNRIEPDKGIFIVESPKVIIRALDAGYEPLAILCEYKHITGDASDIIKRCENVPVYTGNRELLATLTGYVLTRGVLCAMRRPAIRSMEEVCWEARRIVVIDGVVDATNIGAIFRSAAALGIDAVLLTRNSCDPLNRRAVRVSMGAVFLVPWTWLDGSLRDLGKLGFRTAAMALTDHSISIDNHALASESKLAIVMGTEGDGLSPETIAEADYAGQAAKAAGLPVGAVLATDVESAEEQGILSQATNDRNNAAFMKEIQKFGYRADIYTSGSWANNKMTIKGKTGWIASYPYVVSGKNWYSTNHAWQWSSTAKFRISYGGFDVSQLNSNYYTADQKSTVKPTDKDAVKANNKEANRHTFKPSTSAKWVKESKTYTLKTAVKLRTGASTSSSVITILPAGSTVKTDQAIIKGSYRWVRQPRFNGYGYLATGPASNTLEYVKSGAAHTYYTVKSGDSWWTIAQRNGLSMTTLASQNGKSIYTTIYPGQRLVVR